MLSNVYKVLKTDSEFLTAALSQSHILRVHQNCWSPVRSGPI